MEIRVQCQNCNGWHTIDVPSFPEDKTTTATCSDCGETIHELGEIIERDTLKDYRFETELWAEGRNGIMNLLEVSFLADGHAGSLCIHPINSKGIGRLTLNLPLVELDDIIDTMREVATNALKDYFKAYYIDPDGKKKLIYYGKTEADVSTWVGIELTQMETAGVKGVIAIEDPEGKVLMTTTVWGDGNENAD